MRRIHAFGAAVAFVAVTTLATLLGGVGVSSAAPVNDDFAQRSLLSFGAATVADLRGATDEPADQQVVEQCGEPDARYAVWFEFPAVPAGTLVAVELRRTSPAGAPLLEIVTGTPGSFALEGCAAAGTRDGFTGYQAAAGVTYYAVVSDRRGLAGTTATLQLTKLAVQVTGGTLQPDGGVLVSGTFTCPAGRTVDSWVILSLNQKIGSRARATAAGSERVFGASCAAPVPWSVHARPFSGRISGGTVTIDQMPFELCLAGTGACLFVLLPNVSFRIAGANTTTAGPLGPPYGQEAIDITRTRAVTIIDSPQFQATLVNDLAVDNAGNVAVSGTYTCAAGAAIDFASIAVGLDQVVGRGYASGDGGFDVFPTCDGVTRPWSAVVTSYPDLRVRGGKVYLLTRVMAVDEETQELVERFTMFQTQLTARGGKA